MISPTRNPGSMSALVGITSDPRPGDALND